MKKTTPKNKLKPEKRASSEQAKLNAILSSMGEGLVMVDKQLRVVLMNQAAGILLRVAPAEGIGKDVHHLFSLYKGGKKIPIRKSPLDIAIREGNTINLRLEDEIFCRSKAGNLFPLVMSVTGLLEYGEIKGVIIFKDVTREKEVDQMKSEFISIVSHQLRTPLAAIKLFMEMLGNEDVGTLNTQQKDYIYNVQESTARMIELVSDLLNFSRLESGRLKITPKSVRLEEFIQSVIAECTMLGETKQCEVMFQKPEKGPYRIAIDPSLTREVLRNLIMNAIRYSSAGDCKVEVTLEKDRSGYVISIKDNGIGIPKEMQPRIFEKFFRADNARQSQAQGSGLGLYLAKMLIEKSGGKLWFESAGLNKGTTFYISIPMKGMRQKEGVKGVVKK